MSIKKLGEKELEKFYQCKTQDDYVGFVKEMGLQISDADLNAVCGGLADLGNEEALSTLSERLDGAIAKDAVAQRILVK